MIQNVGQVDLVQPELNSLKIYIVIAVAMEVEGRLTAVKVEKAFNSRELAQKYMDSMPASYPDKIRLPEQSINCLCERNVYEVEVEG